MKTIQDVIALEAQIRLLNEYQGHLVDRTKRLALELEGLLLELEEKEWYIQKLEKLITRADLKNFN